MARRPFDASFSRRAGEGQGHQHPMGEHGHFGGGRSGGGGGYDEEEYGHLMGGGSGGGSRLYEEDLFCDQPVYEKERIPRDATRAKLHRQDDWDPPSAGSGGWRQRSPSPGQRYPSSREAERERPMMRSGGGASGGGGSWMPRPDERSGGGGGFDNFRPQQQMFSSNAGILRNPENVVMVLPPSQGAGGLLGLNANPFGVGMLGQAPMVVGNISGFNPSPFGQQMLQASTPFGQGVGLGMNIGGGGGGGSSIYGPQTQQPFNRSQNLITAANSGRGGGGGGRRGGMDRDRVRRSDGGGNLDRMRSNSNSRNSADSPRKRNLVLRDPRPEDVKRPRTSEGNAKKANDRSSTTKVKRISIGEEKKSGGQPYRKKTSEAPKDKEKKADAEIKDKKKGDKSKEKKKEKDADKKTEFDELPGSLLVCKVCQKVMNDGQSFESHLSGRAHQSLLRIMEEKFAKRVELLMTESKCAEEEIGIEMDRQRRAGAGKSGRAEKNASNYCKMCDCYYAVNWGTHKVSMGHRILKEFLHPTCKFCKKDFMHRKDWVTHLLSIGHLRRLVEMKKENPELNLEDQESPFQDELFTIFVDLNRDERPTNAITIKSKDGREALTEEMKEILKNDRGEIMLPEGEIPLPKEYNAELMVGGDAVVAVSGNRCRVCRVYIAEDKSVEAHCSSREHFNHYVSFLKRVNRHREHKEKDRKEAEEKAKREEERAKRRAEEKVKKEAEDAIMPNGEGTEETPEEKEKTTESEIKMEVDVEGEKKEEEEDQVDEDSSKAEGVVENEKVIELVDVDEAVDDEDFEDEEEGDEEVGDEEENEDEGEEEAEGDEKAELEEEDSSSADVVADDGNSVDAEGADADSGDVEMVEGGQEGEEHLKAVEQEQTEDAGKTTEQVESTADNNEESSDSVQIEEEAPAVLKTPAATFATGRRGRRETPATRGRTTPSLRNVTAKVDSNLRGARTGRGRSPRGGRGRGAR